MASIREVAKIAGVSPATVSRVMNGTANVDDEKRARVLSAISETGFIPNEVARSLFKKSAKTIGLIVPSIENAFFTKLSRVIEEVADKNGYRLLLCNAGRDGEKEKSLIQMMISMNVDGIIVTTSNEELRPILNECNIPIVVTDRGPEKLMNCDYVHADHYAGGRMAVKHLIDCGCINIVCIRGPVGVSSADERFRGYADVCREYGMEEKVIECDYDFQAGLKATEEILKKHPEVDGIVACNDMVAISVYKQLHRSGIAVPGQVQVVGYDDINLASLVTPELTTVAQPVEDIGRKAAELIINKNMAEKQEYVFEVKLKERETTKKEEKNEKTGDSE